MNVLTPAPNVTFWIGALMILLMAAIFMLMPFKRTKALAAALWMGSIVGIATLGLYQHYGALNGVEDKALMTLMAQKLSALQSGELASREKVLNVIEEIESKLPSRPLPWAYLGGIYQHLGFLDKGAAAYHQAFELNPESFTYLIQEAYLVSKLNQGLLSTRLKDNLNLLLRQEADNSDILTLLAMDAYQQKDYLSVIRYCQHLLTKVPSLSSQEITNIEGLLLKAKGLV